MPVVTCTCGKKYQAPEHLAGKRVKCKACGATFDVSPTQPALDLDPIPDLSAIPPDEPRHSRQATPLVTPRPTALHHTSGSAGGSGAERAKALLLFLISPRGRKLLSALALVAIIMVVAVYAGRPVVRLVQGWRAIAALREEAMPKVSADFVVDGIPGKDSSEIDLHVVAMMEAIGLKVRSGAPLTAHLVFRKVGSRSEAFRIMGTTVIGKIDTPPDITYEVPQVDIELTFSDSSGRSIWQRKIHCFTTVGFSQSYEGSFEDAANKTVWKSILTQMSNIPVPPLSYLTSPPETLPSNALDPVAHPAYPNLPSTKLARSPAPTATRPQSP